jgi:hypothetical protein
MSRLALTLLLAALALPRAALALGDDGVTTLTLDNGLDVVVIEDHTAPAVTHMVWYRVGAADEPPGQSGIAHFLEHLMFKGTEAMPDGAFSRLIAANGGTENAFTSWDYTAYFQTVAADRLGLMMTHEADRMANLRLSPEDVETERGVILEERAQRTDSDPGALFAEQLRAALFLNHPYGVPIIGWRHEMAELDRAAALDFYRRHYAPTTRSWWSPAMSRPRRCAPWPKRPMAGCPWHRMSRRSFARPSRPIAPNGGSCSRMPASPDPMSRAAIWCRHARRAIRVMRQRFGAGRASGAGRCHRPAGRGAAAARRHRALCRGALQPHRPRRSDLRHFRHAQ